MLKAHGNQAWMLIASLFGFFGSMTACAGVEEDASESDVNQSEFAAERGTVVPLSNPGFEDGKTGWQGGSSFSISDVEHTGSKSAKITSSSGLLRQTVTVTPNTDYTLSAWLLGKARIGVQSGSTVLGSQRVDNGSWAEAQVTFNSGSASSVTLFGAHNGGEGRFDDFTLVARRNQPSTPGPSTPEHGDAVHPADVLDLSSWHLTLPIDTSHPGDPDQIEQPELDTFAHDSLFFLNGAKDGVVFRAYADGETTGGSGYPRSELRERMNRGEDLAAWSSSSGTHIMTIEQAVTHLPDVKPHIVVGQIHDGSDDVIVFRLEGKKLFIDLNGGTGPTLTSNYALGTRFKVKFEVANNRVKCYYNDELKYTYSKSFSGAYFKAGAYVQSSCKGRKKVAGESCRAYGENVIYDLKVEHR